MVAGRNKSNHMKGFELLLDARDYTRSSYDYYWRVAHEGFNSQPRNWKAGVLITDLRVSDLLMK